MPLATANDGVLGVSTEISYEALHKQVARVGNKVIILEGITNFEIRTRWAAASDGVLGVCMPVFLHTHSSI